MQYRIFTLADIPMVVELYVESFNAAPWNDNWTAQTASKRLSQMLDRASAYGLLGYDTSGICGLIVGDEEQFYDGLQFQIREFCVAQHRKGQGIGTALYRELEEHLKQRGVVKILLNTLHHPVTEGFYKHLGFDFEKDICMMKKEL